MRSEKNEWPFVKYCSNTTWVAGVAQLGEQQTEARAVGCVFWRSRVQSTVLAFLPLQAAVSSADSDHQSSRSTTEFVLWSLDSISLLVGRHNTTPFLFSHQVTILECRADDALFRKIVLRRGVCLRNTQPLSRFSIM